MTIAQKPIRVNVGAANASHVSESKGERIGTGTGIGTDIEASTSRAMLSLSLVPLSSSLAAVRLSGLSLASALLVTLGVPFMSAAVVVEAADAGFTVGAVGEFDGNDGAEERVDVKVDAGISALFVSECNPVEEEDAIVVLEEGEVGDCDVGDAEKVEEVVDASGMRGCKTDERDEEDAAGKEPNRIKRMRNTILRVCRLTLRPRCLPCMSKGE